MIDVRLMALWALGSGESVEAAAALPGLLSLPDTRRGADEANPVTLSLSLTVGRSKGLEPGFQA